jgi:hypothetical protein
MAEKLDPKEVVDLKELLMSNVYEQEALVNLLVKKEIITKAEFLEELWDLKQKMARGKKVSKES